MGKFIEKLKTDRKTQMTVLVVVGLVIIGVVLLYYFVLSKDGGVSFDLNDDKKSLLAERRLDGVMVEPEKANLFPEGVMIENLVSIRPQSGLEEAGIVYEAVVEGGITRFMAMYAGEEAEEIGPVRSARPYYVEWNSEYDALYVHCGGSPEALEMISAFNVLNINQIGGDHGYFWRDNSIAAPHNLFTSSEFLTFALRDKDFQDKTPTYESWLFKDEAAKSGRPTEEKTITIDFSGPDYLVEYEYDADSNTYLRFNGGVEHLDRNSGDQLAPTNVVIQKVESRVTDNEGRLEQDVVGIGDAIVFRDGEAIEGTWEKDDRVSRTKFLDKNGQEIALDRGQTWVEVVPTDRTVDYN